LLSFNKPAIKQHQPTHQTLTIARQDLPTACRDFAGFALTHCGQDARAPGTGHHNQPHRTHAPSLPGTQASRLHAVCAKNTPCRDIHIPFKIQTLNKGRRNYDQGDFP